MYREIDGVAMGSPLGEILANAFLCHFENSGPQNECPTDFLPKIFKRYVDDIFVMFLCQSHLKDFVNYMNTNIQTLNLLQNLRKITVSLS